MEGDTVKAESPAQEHDPHQGHAQERNAHQGLKLDIDFTCYLHSDLQDNNYTQFIC